MENKIWHECLSLLKREMTSQQYNTWIRPLKVLSDDQDICLLAPNKFIRDWIKDKYLQKIEDIICEVVDDDIKGPPMIYLASASPRLMSYKMCENTNNKHIEAKETINREIKKDSGIINVATFAKRQTTTVVRKIYSSNTVTENKIPKVKNTLNDKFTFDNFIKGESNKVALSSALKVADSPGLAYNPLFLYGGVGLGKTHLMHAVGNFLFNKNKAIKIVYLHAERFVRDMVRSLQINAINEFKKYYRSVDTLLIDDIQFFSGKTRSQEEFFHTFNDLLDGGQQVILTCDRYPEKISGINERLRSRFGKGLTVAIETPDLKTRIAILKQKANKNNIVLPDNVASFIASRVNANIRELEGALKRIIASSNFLNEKITIDLTKEALKDVIALYDKQIDVVEIQNVISDYYKIPIIDIISKSRNKAIVLSRQMGMAISKELTDCSFPEIGKAFGGKDHTTVMHACSKIKQLVEYNPEIHKDFKYLMKHLAN